MPEKKELLYLLEIGPSNSGELSRPLTRDAIEQWCKENRMGGTVYGPVTHLPLAGVFEVGGGWVEPQEESAPGPEVSRTDNPVQLRASPDTGRKKKASSSVRSGANGAARTTGAGKKKRPGKLLEGTGNSSSH